MSVVAKIENDRIGWSELTPSDRVSLPLGRETTTPAVPGDVRHLLGVRDAGRESARTRWQVSKGARRRLEGLLVVLGGVPQGSVRPVDREERYAFVGHLRCHDRVQPVHSQVRRGVVL